MEEWRNGLSDFTDVELVLCPCAEMVTPRGRVFAIDKEQSKLSTLNCEWSGRRYFFLGRLDHGLYFLDRFMNRLEIYLFVPAQ